MDTFSTKYAEYVDYVADQHWYQNFLPEMERLFRGADPEDPTELAQFEKDKTALRELFVQLYKEDKIAFGTEGKDFDAARLPVDTIVVHHTAGQSDASWEFINIQHLFRLYIPEHLNPKRDYSGKPIWSNHFSADGKMIFCAYHNLIWPDGTVKQMLQDDQIGWHAGNWDINCRSVAVTFVGDLSESAPTAKAIAAAGKIIAKFPGVNVIGHREVAGTNTICPGNKFLGEDGWKKQLVET